MNELGEVIGGIIVIAFFALLVAVPLAAGGYLYTTGTTWYEACWKLTSASKTLGDPPPTAPDPYTDALWKTCEVTAERAVYDRGMVFAGMAKDNQDVDGLALQQACPYYLTDVPMGGLHFLAVRLIQEQGGPDILDKVFPAKLSVGRYLNDRWPSCNKERERQHYPRIVETSPGKFAWETPCVPCEKRKAAGE